ncbi:MAG: hypothetical protein ACUVS2_09320 [Candidatus Flexifilum sp.]
MAGDSTITSFPIVAPDSWRVLARGCALAFFSAALPDVGLEPRDLPAEPARLALLVVFVERLVEAERFVFEAFAFEAFASCWPFG